MDPRPLIVALTFVLASPAWAQEKPSQEPLSNAAKLLRQNHVRPGWYLVNGRWMRPSIELTWSTLIDLEVRDGRLLVSARNTDYVDRLLYNDRQVLAAIGQSPLAYLVSAQGRAWTAGRAQPSQHLQVAAAAGNLHDVAGLYPTAVRIAPARVVIEGAGTSEAGRLPVVATLTLDSRTGRAALSVTHVSEDGQEPILHADAADVLTLLTDRPRSMRQYVLPLLTTLNHGTNPLSPQPGDVYRAFEEVAAPADATAALLKAMEPLSSPDPAERAAAAASLDDLGPDGVLAAVRLDRSTLTPEERLRLQQFIARNSLYPNRAPAALLKDAYFLFDALADPDPAVRAAAHHTLSKLLNQNLPLDIAAPRAAELQAIREAIDAR